MSLRGGPGDGDFELPLCPPGNQVSYGLSRFIEWIRGIEALCQQHVSLPPFWQRLLRLCA